jgi:protein TonB
MSPIEIQEPEVKPAKPAKPASCQMAAILPSSDIIWGPALPLKTMFSDSLLEFGVQRKRKFLATTTSLIVNCLAIVAMLIIPLAFPEALPQLLTFLVAPPPPPPAAAEVQHVVRQIQTDMLNNGALRTPTKIPQKIQMIKEEEAPPPMPASGGVVGGVPRGLPGGQMGGVIGSVISATSSLAVPKFVPATPQRIRIFAGVTKGLLIQRIEPPILRSQERHEFRGTSC